MTDDAREASIAFAAPLVALTLGHVLSNLVRTLPAVAADVLGRDLGVTPGGLASLIGAFTFAFALAQIPLGVALDRLGVRRTALILLATAGAGALLAAAARGPVGFLLAQVVLGLGCAGMLMGPVTYAAKRLSPARFGLWSGLIQALGNSGMLLSASPFALLVEAQGWRAGYLASAALAALAFALVLLLVRPEEPAQGPARSLAADAREVLSLAASPGLRGLTVLAFASFAAVLGVRGLWGGSWLMEVKGLSRVEAGNVLLLATAAVVAGPALWGLADRRFGSRRALLVLGHLVAAGALLLTAMGGPGGPLGGRGPGWDTATLLLFFLAISAQPLAFAAARAAVPPERAGKALAGVNLSFFAGAAVLQAVSGPVVASAGLAVGLGFFAAMLVLSTLGYAALTRGPAPNGPGR